MSKIKLKKDKTKFEKLYLLDVPVYFACVHRPRLKYESKTEKEYQLTAFVDTKMRTLLEDKVMVNKTLYEVGVDKNKKRKIKYPLDIYGDMEGLHGLSLSCNEFKKDGSESNFKVVQRVGSKGVPFEEDLGNGTIVDIRCWGYRNKDELLVVSLDLVSVKEHIPYERAESSDDVLGFSTSTGKEDEVPFDEDTLDLDDDIDDFSEI